MSEVPDSCRELLERVRERSAAAATRVVRGADASRCCPVDSAASSCCGPQRAQRGDAVGCIAGARSEYLDGPAAAGFTGGSAGLTGASAWFTGASAGFIRRAADGMHAATTRATKPA
ncbi:MAG: hypothetical protein J2P23_09190 [Microlunatus sp.]|nr:hypothetical protein [Microlunatus sp.]